MSFQNVREFVLSLPGVTEEPHHDKTSFRVCGKIFATVPPNEQYVHILLDEAMARSIISAQPDAFEELLWGKRIVGVRVKLDAVDEDLLASLLEEAYDFHRPTS